MKRKPFAGNQKEMGDTSTKEENIKAATVILEARLDQTKKANIKEIAPRNVSKVKISHMVYEQL